jgi:catechol 2,3-dioxygenase-like lactoylglutathione lyase family enzyme
MLTQTKLSRLGHVAVQVQDVAKAVAFYSDLGMEVAWQDSDWAYVKAGNDGLALLGPDYKHAGPHFGFVFHDPDEIQPYYDKLQAQGYTASKILDHRDGTRSFYAKDPDGNLFEFLYEPAVD